MYMQTIFILAFAGKICKGTDKSGADHPEIRFL